MEMHHKKANKKLENAVKKLEDATKMQEKATKTHKKILFSNNKYPVSRYYRNFSEKFFYNLLNSLK